MRAIFFFTDDSTIFTMLQDSVVEKLKSADWGKDIVIIDVGGEGKTGIVNLRNVSMLRLEEEDE